MADQPAAGRPSRAARAAERRERRAELTEPGPVMEAAANFLAARPRSVAETRRRLRHLGYPAALVDGVIDRLTEMGYLDDEEFARGWLESRDRARPRGSSALRRELQLKGVSREVIASVMDQRTEAAPDADLSAALALLERRSASLAREADPRRRRQRAYALLARNGFDPEVCHAAAASLEQAIEPGDT